MSGIRFAPSPTGRFHVGNLRTAWISRELARALGEPWVVRFEDIDRPRVLAGAREQQLADLEALGLRPDEVVVQSDLHARHEALFERARAEGRVYPCSCSRKEVQQALAQMASAPHAPAAAYSGACRPREPGAPPPAMAAPAETLAWRFRGEEPSGRDDLIVARTRPDGSGFQPAYAWACAIDDWEGRHSWLVRAWDLAEATPPQRAIQAWLRRDSDRPFPCVLHTSLVVQDDGRRLEKRTRGVTLDELLSRSDRASLLRLFKESFDPALLAPASHPSELRGETRRELTVSALGLTDLLNTEEQR